MENNKIKDKIDDLVESLNRASKAYYNGADEIMPNYEWDALFDELTQLEKETGYIRQDSPTQNAGYEAEAGNREPHEYPARQRVLRSLRNGQVICQSGFHGSLTD